MGLMGPSLPNVTSLAKLALPHTPSAKGDTFIKEKDGVKLL